MTPRPRSSAPDRTARVIHAAALFGIVITIAGCGPNEHVQVAAPAGHWISLFNGHDLDGWTAKIAGSDYGDNYRRTFRVEDGLLRVSYRDYGTFGNRFGSLFYNTPYSHYWLRVEYRFKGEPARGAPGWTYKNSGIQLHSQPPWGMRRDQQFPVSVEFDLVGGRMIGSRPTGDVCHYGTTVSIAGRPLTELCSTLSDITIRDDRWVTALAEVDGDHVRQAVNGALIVEYAGIALDPANADGRQLIGHNGPKRLASGYISLQSNGYPIEFRRIEVLALDAPAAVSSP